MPFCLFENGLHAWPAIAGMTPGIMGDACRLERRSLFIRGAPRVKGGAPAPERGAVI